MYADVLIQYRVKSLDHTFTYHVPSELENDLKVGMKVKVPFGNTTTNGFVVGLKKEAEGEIKDIISIITKELKLTDELLELGKYISQKTLCTLIAAYQTMLPTSLKVNNDKEDYTYKKVYIVLNKDKDIDTYIINNKRNTKQIELLKMLKNGKVLQSEINGSSLKKLLELDLVKKEIETLYRINHDDITIHKNILTKDQDEISNCIKNNLNIHKTYLLHGITGSGKTEVYMDICEEVIKNNKSVIILVPEITLTTQIISRFYERFGNDVAIYHSNLSDGEKYDEYKKILNGEVHIVVGTRSSIFAPVKNLGLVIIDEEHSSTYKQDNTPRYHAKDIAEWRCIYHNCPLVLGSATPTLESMARAGKGVYEYLKLDKRVGNAKLPSISLVDMAPEYRCGKMILSRLLEEKIMDRLNKHEQVMLLLNRRGYSNFITCQSCGFTYKCPHCDITLTYHKSSNHMRCHYCGYTLIKSDNCPECNEKALMPFGCGTEKLEQYVKELYPSYNIVRMDMDTTTKKGSHERIIKSIENHEYDIIIGTQMISKGLDFKSVTLVGIVNADESLNIPDFRSGENTYSLLSQVSGRAGRSNLPGEVIIQTFNPDNKTLNYVKNNDYIGNYNYEMNIRKTLKYPPYYYLLSIKVTGKDYSILSSEANKVASYLRSNLSSSTIILGPTTAAIFRINNVYRFQILIKYRKDDNLINVIKSIDEQYAFNKDVSIEVDVDPLKI